MRKKSSRELLREALTQTRCDRCGSAPAAVSNKTVVSRNGTRRRVSRCINCL